MTEVQEAIGGVGQEGGRSWFELKEQMPEGVTDINQALQLADLEWSVEKVAVAVDFKGNWIKADESGWDSGPPKPIFEATVRSDNGYPLGIVTPRYSVVQTADALSICQDIAEQGDATFKAVGAYRNGRKVWAFLELPQKLHIAGDLVSPTLAFVTHHDGGGAVSVANMPFRDACTNMLALDLPPQPDAVSHGALGHTGKLVKLRHSGDVKTKVERAHELLAQHHAYMEEFAAIADRLAIKKVGKDMLRRWLEELYPEWDSMGDRAASTVREARETVEYLVQRAPNLEGHHGTAWAFVNAVAEQQDWGRARVRERMGTLLWGARERQVKNHALRIAMAHLN